MRKDGYIYVALKLIKLVEYARAIRKKVGYILFCARMEEFVHLIIIRVGKLCVSFFTFFFLSFAFVLIGEKI